MKHLQDKPQLDHGSSLIETVIAMGVLAVIIPLVFGTIAESGKTGMSSAAETRSTWIVPACLAEAQGSREGKPRYFTATKTGEAFPPVGSIWAIGFSPEGEAVGKIEKSAYDRGVKEIYGEPVRFIASISADSANTSTQPAMLRLRVSIEYPSTVPAVRRQKIDFYTRIP